MSVLILGNNEINSTLEKQMNKDGFSTNVVKNVDDLVSVKGKPGDYIVKTKNKEYLVSTVIITEPYSIDDVIVNDEKIINILNTEILNKLYKSKTNEPVVFLLDYISESPEFIAINALKAAKKLVEQKKQVIFLSKTVKTLSKDSEQLYLETRMAGVTFAKYQDVSLTYDEDKRKFLLTYSDGVFETSLETTYLFSAGGRKDGNLSKLTSKFRLSTHGGGLINEDRFFVAPVLTSRRGIFYFSPNSTVSGDLEVLKIVVPEIDEVLEDSSFDEDCFVHAVVDPRKCAFCYTCFRACPHGAMEADIENSSMINTANACEACGVCVSVCPAEAIYINEEIGLTADEMKPGKSNKCKIFCCENSAEQAFDEISTSLTEYSHRLDIVPIPCGGRISLEMITTALATFDNVMVAVCMDDACRHFGGGKRACLQVERTKNMLKNAGIPEKSVEYVKVSHVMGQVLKENIENFLKRD